jgi:hypothetical protein
MGWIGIDLDRTLAEYHKWEGYEAIGKPIPTVLDFVKRLIVEGKEVRIFTARAHPIVQPVREQFTEYQIGLVSHFPELQGAMRACNAIREWCIEHIGRTLTITCVKDYHMDTLYDDRAVQVVANKGLKVNPCPDLSYVIGWLKNGYDVQGAIKELQFHQETRYKW